MNRIVTYLRVGLVVSAVVLWPETSLRANGGVKVVTTLPDLKYIVEQVGGSTVDVFAIAKGYQDPHFVDAKPSFVLRLNKADLFVQIGLDLEVGWVPPLLEAARNKRIYFGGSGLVNGAHGVDLLEVPQVDPSTMRAGGDIHVFGNPHYWLDPRNGKVIAENIYNALKAIRPDDEAFYRRNTDRFAARIDSAYQHWSTLMAPYAGTRIIAYHNSWPYFEQAFGIDIVGFIEPKPGIPPAPSHLVSVIKQMRDEKLKTIIISPYFDDKPAQSLARRTGAKVVAMAPSVGAFPQIITYFDLFEHNITMLLAAFRNSQ